jgi:DNA-binding beta-propeller fold protein YncE
MSRSLSGSISRSLQRSVSPRLFVLPLVAMLLGSPTSHGGELLRPDESRVLEGTHGKFDFLSIDAAKRRLLAAHTGNNSLDVIDLDAGKLVKSISTGAAQAAVADAKGEKYFVAVSKPPQAVVVDAEKGEVVSKTALSGPADLLALNPRTGLLYVDHDDGKDVWEIDPASGKILKTVALPGDSPEDLGFDAAHERLFQCMKNGSVVAVIELASGKVVESWPTAPAAAPHGMAVITEEHALAIAGGNGKLVLLSDKDGHVISSTDIPPRVDQIAYDKTSHRIYCASGTGKIAVVRLTDGTLSTLGEVASSEGCHSIAVDPQTHRVWIAYAKGDQSFVRSYTPAD